MNEENPYQILKKLQDKKIDKKTIKKIEEIIDKNYILSAFAIKKLDNHPEKNDQMSLTTLEDSIKHFELIITDSKKKDHIDLTINRVVLPIHH